MTMKGGAREGTVFQTVRQLKEKGLSTQEAISEVEGILRGKLPAHIVAMVYRECG